MPTYIGKVQINDNGELMPIGSTLYGKCESGQDAQTKVITIDNFDNYIKGVTIHVIFTNGNTATTNVKLQINSLSQVIDVANAFRCNKGDVVSFTLEEYAVEPSGNFEKKWRVNTTRALIESSNNIITAIDGQQVNVATKSYVDSKTASIDGITGPMHFKGIVQELPQDNTGYTSGDVIVFGQQEYVYDGTTWRLLGDEGSYALKSSTASAVSAIAFNAGALPELGDAIVMDEVTGWNAGTASNATVNGGVLQLTNSTVPTLQRTTRSIPNITSLGTLPSLTVTPITVVVPDNSVTP